MENDSFHTRRNFVKLAALGTMATMPLISTANSLFETSFLDNSDLDVSIFSKHLQFLDYKTTGEMAAEMGFSGVDLTVRPKGHVLPENVKTDLPKAIKAIQDAGSQCKMITTTIESVSNPMDVDIITTAGALGINYYRPNWFKFKVGLSLPESLQLYQKEIQQLTTLNEKSGIIGAYQNHAGRHVGSSCWEVDRILTNVNPAYFGSEFDIRHAMVEGFNSWENGFELLKSKIKIIVLKDYRYEKVNGKWDTINVPIGEGMVNFDGYFKLLKKNNLKPAVTLHLEYDLGGAEKGNTTITIDKKVVFEAMKKDLKAIQKLWKEA